MHKYYPILLLLLGCFLGGCVSYPKMVYLYDKEVTVDSPKIYPDYEAPSYRVRPHDQLIININSYQDNTTTFFNSGTAISENTRVTGGPAFLFLNSYAVDDSGYVKLPVIGKQYVTGKTTDEIQSLFEVQLKPYFKFVSTSVKLSNFQVVVMGEVKRPGNYYIYNSKTTLPQVLGMASDITEFGNTQRIKVVREIDAGTKTAYVNLADPAIFSSEFYIMRPGDIVYVEPVKAKAFNVNTRTASLTLSAASLIVVVVDFILNRRNP